MFCDCVLLEAGRALYVGFWTGFPPHLVQGSCGSADDAPETED